MTERSDKQVATTRLAGDAGAALAEAALITPVFIFLFFGILEFGGAFRDYLTMSNVVTSATRQAAIQGNNLNADWMILEDVKRSSSAMPLKQINMVVVYKASGPSSGVPSGCKTASQNVGSIANPGVGSCNRYTVSNIQDTANGPSWNCVSGPIRFYCPANRKITLVGTGPDYLGVYVQITHPWVTGLFGSQITMSDSSVTKLEPQKLA